MFTGLIESVGLVRAIEPRGKGARLTIETDLTERLSTGESLAVNGCCLTVTGQKSGTVFFDLLAETISRTNLGNLNPGARVNLERAMPADGRFGGHFVQGHIDTTAEVYLTEISGLDLNLAIELPEAGKPYLIEKGSIAVNGVSLTVASLSEDRFGLWIIPITLQKTNLGDLRKSHRVNLEYDLIAKYTKRQFSCHAQE